VSSVEFASLSEEEQVATLQPLIGSITDRYPLEVTGVESIHHGFNSTFRLDTADGGRYALRINVNSDRTLANLAAEIFFVQSIEEIKTAKPVAMSDGSFVGTVWHNATNRKLHFVLYEWLNGVELSTDPNPANLFAAGEAMAKLHLASKDLVLPEGTELPLLNDALWGLPNHYHQANEHLSEFDLALILPALAEAQKLYEAQFQGGQTQIIHSDLHGANLMWDAALGEIAVFDFDDSAIGTPLQDLATALYYLEPAQRQIWLDGYSSVSPPPNYSDKEWDTLMIQRRLFLLNYVFDTSDPKAKALLAQYLKPFGV
jgi:Ser/Thr protein kinase RdoA (MazF antagonist)